jgi:hypothetical protein
MTATMNLRAKGLKGWDALVQNHVNSHPVVFAFNIKKEIHDVYGLRLHQNPVKQMQKEPNNRIFTLPIFNYSGTLTIDSRAKKIRNEIRKVPLLKNVSIFRVKNDRF